jgi:hypothetical protein
MPATQVARQPRPARLMASRPACRPIGHYTVRATVRCLVVRPLSISRRRTPNADPRCLLTNINSEAAVMMMVVVVVMMVVTMQVTRWDNAVIAVMVVVMVMVVVILRDLFAALRL